MKRLVSRFFVIAGFGLWGCLAFMSQLIWAYYNLRFGRSFPRTAVTPMVDASLLTMDVPRRWLVKPSYVYLWMPYVSLWPHADPVMIAWYEDNESNLLTLFLLVEEKGGFTHNIRKYAPTDNSLPTTEEFARPPVSTKLSGKSSSLLTLFNGPYCSKHDFGEYGTVVMFATGTCVTAFLLHIRSLLERRLNFEVCTQRVMLFWQIEKEGDPRFLCMLSVTLTLVLYHAD